MLANGVSARLADVDPIGHIHTIELELEEGVVRDRLDHAANSARLDDREHGASGRRIVTHLNRASANTQLVIVGTESGMDNATLIATEIPSLR